MCDISENKVVKKTRAENEEEDEGKEDTINEVEEERDQEINDIDAEGHHEK